MRKRVIKRIRKKCRDTGIKGLNTATERKESSIIWVRACGKRAFLFKITNGEVKEDAKAKRTPVISPHLKR